MTARFIVADVFDGLATIPDGSVDLVITSPPFLALRSYLPADHPDKDKEIGSEATPAEFIDVLLKVTVELRRVLASHGSICVELGDTYAGSGAGGDYNDSGLQTGDGAAKQARHPGGNEWEAAHPIPVRHGGGIAGGHGWPLSKSRTLIPSLYQIALAYGFNPLTGQESPAGQWRIRNVVTWARPNPPVGALGDKWRPATSDLIVACTSSKRYWDDLATRKPHKTDPALFSGNGYTKGFPEGIVGNESMPGNSSGAPLLDYWEIPPTGYSGSHYAVFPPALVEPCVKAMCPPKVCLTCGEPSRRITGNVTYGPSQSWAARNDGRGKPPSTLHMREGEQVDPMVRQWKAQGDSSVQRREDTLGWTDCGHDNYRPGLILDPFAGSGTTLLVATGHGHDAVGIDLDERNAELARERVGPFLFEEETV